MVASNADDAVDPETRPTAESSAATSTGSETSSGQSEASSATCATDRERPSDELSPSTDTEYVLVTEYFHPETASTGQLMTDLAVGLVDRGLDLSVITAQPSYRGTDTASQPARENHDGVPVRRLRAPQVRQTSLLRRLFNWTVFTLWVTAVLAVQRRDDRHLLFVSNPPFLPLAMWPLCALKGWEYTYVVYDLYPDVVVAAGYLAEGGAIDRAWTALHERVFGAATTVVALGPVMRERILTVADGRASPEDVVVVHNWADGEFIRPLAKAENPFSREHDLVEPFTLVYSGNIGANHDLETVVRAAARFDPDELRLLVIGEGDAKADVVALAASLGVAGETVRFLPFQDLADLPHTLTSGDVSVVAVQEGMAGLCVSSKLYTSLAAGQPVLVVAESDGDEARIVEGNDAGIQVRQGDVGGAVAAIERWRSNPELVDRQGDNAREAFEARFTKTHAIDEYYRLLAARGTTGSSSTTVEEPAESGPFASEESA